MVTGGIAPNRQGWLAPFRGKTDDALRSKPPPQRNKRPYTTKVENMPANPARRPVRHASHARGALSAAARISPFRPWEMSPRLIRATIDDFRRTVPPWPAKPATTAWKSWAAKAT
jgi:2,4-dienoyl-CoA reductase (NADPH2)